MDDKIAPNIRYRIGYLLTVLTVSIITGLCPGDIYAKENNEHYSYVKAIIYYKGWYILYRSRVTAEDVRLGYWIKTEIVEKWEIDNFVKWLQLDKINIVDTEKDHDVRLVIDFFDSNGVITSFYSNGFSLFSKDTKLKRSVGKTFKEKFHF